MKKIIWFSLIGLLFTGCAKSSHRQHEIMCFDSANHTIVTHHVLTYGNVWAFVVKGYSVLCYRNADNTKTELIDFSKNDCRIY